MKDKLIFISTTLIIMLFIVSLSISAPILVRPFYYAQINNLNLVNDTGFLKEQIRDAYDEMLDYCLGLTDEFGVGDLLWSESGKAHFDDVKALFSLDLYVLAITSVYLIVYVIVIARKKYKPHGINGYTPSFYSSIVLISLMSLTAVICAMDFNAAFNVFHRIFFPGKDNWIFDHRTDEIILILPEEFFMRCALCILVIILILCMSLIIYGIARKNFPYRRLSATNKEN